MQFISGSGYMDDKKNLYFGSTKGLNIFHPNRIPHSAQLSKLLFTNFRVLNQDVVYGSNSIYKKHISISKEINLPYGQSLFSFHFSYLNYINPEKTTYLYKMRGFDDNWISSHGHNFATYTNLDPGTYTFLVKALNDSDRGYTRPTSITLIITPPYYKTIWFRFLLSAILIFLVLFLFWLRIRLTERKSKALHKANLKLELEIRERKRTEQLYKAEKVKAEKASEAKSNFLSTMSHEIRTPLNIIIGSLDLIEREKGEIKSFLSTIKISANNLLRIINNILDITKIEQGKLTFENEAFSLDEFCETIYSLFNTTIEKKGLKFKVSCNVEHQYVIGDNFRLNQMITNLIGNAIKFTSEGTISLQIISISNKTESTRIQFKVSDTGTGISSDKKESIFGKFNQENDSITRNFGGTGLGLAIVKEMANELNGEIKVDSTLGEGTDFYLTLDFVKAKKAQSERSPKTPEIDHLNDIRILTIDDNPFNLDLSKSILELHGGTVDQALSAKAGLKLLESNSYDVIISDIHMPEMDGFQFAEEVKNMESKIPIIGCTADVFEETRNRSKEVGMSYLITKPFEIDDLIKKIHTALKSGA
jgi:signal transduction histidine kinase/CheY-like chemotaxis protein